MRDPVDAHSDERRHEGRAHTDEHDAGSPTSETTSLLWSGCARNGWFRWRGHEAFFPGKIRRLTLRALRAPSAATTQNLRDPVCSMRQAARLTQAMASVPFHR